MSDAGALAPTIRMPASSDQPLSYSGDDSASALRCALVVSEFNRVVTEQLLAHALSTLEERGVHRGALTVVWVPGAVELPLTAKRLAITGQYEAVICLGAVIRGETAHFDLVVQMAGQGIGRVALETGVPVIFGLLATDTLEQALERAQTGPRNRGREAALAAVKMATLLRRLK